MMTLQVALARLLFMKYSTADAHFSLNNSSLLGSRMLIMKCFHLIVINLSLLLLYSLRMIMFFNYILLKVCELLQKKTLKILVPQA